MLTRMEERSGSDYLRNRYGNSQNSRPRWILPAVILLLVGGSWLLWSANHYSKPEVSTELISFTTSNPKAVTFRYFINVRTASRSHQCIVTATDYQANIVGQITDTIPAGRNNYNRTIVIPTRAPAVSATIEHCS